MPEETLILKRNPDAKYSESHNVLFEGRYVGRIYTAVSHAPREAPWFWGLDFFEWQGSDGPQYGHVASLEAAKQAFRAAWDRSWAVRRQAFLPQQFGNQISGH
jgi:hypothetical protein